MKGTLANIWSDFFIFIADKIEIKWLNHAHCYWECKLVQPLWKTVWRVLNKLKINPAIRSDQIRSVTQSCLTLCDPMNSSTPGLPVHHQLPEFTEAHVHQVSETQQYNPAIPLLGIYQKKTKTLIQKDTGTPMFIAALFTIAKIWKQLSIHRPINE